MQPICSSFLFAAAACLCLAGSSQAQYTISELLINPPGADNTQETLEIQGLPAGPMTGWWFLSIEGDSTASGTLDQAVDLSPFTMDAVGVLTIRADASAILPLPCIPPPYTWVVYDFSPDLENGTNTFVLGSGTPPAVGTDLDTDDDGVIDAGALGTFVPADAVAVTDGDAGDLMYGAALGGFDVPYDGYTPSALYRIYDASGAPCNWNGGTVSGPNPGGPYTWNGTQIFGFMSHGICPPEPHYGCRQELPDFDFDGIANACDPDSVVVEGPFCQGTVAGCPCGGTVQAGTDGLGGCDNSSFTGGARLAASGIASIGSDSLVVTADRLPTGAPILFFEGTLREAGGAGVVFGDGLRCVTGNLCRIGVKFATGDTASYPETGDTEISVRCFAICGSVRHHQGWYRDAAAFCAPEFFNLTNGWTVVWRP
ncbi:MAG: hypothetical protein JNL28_00415 [Planctomycetes bacterium]|nr:hypothetical protein [Planctomycetota bacterium]